MAFDFLGTFTRKMWETFESFAETAVYSKILSYFPQETIQSETEIFELEPYSPSISDHLVAERARMLVYRNKLDVAYQSEKLSTLDRSKHHVHYLPKEGASFPPSSVGGEVSDTLKDFYVVFANDDYKMADTVMLIKSKISKLIKSYYERYEYRLRKCDFFINETDKFVVDVQSLALDDTYQYALNKVRSQINESPFVIQSQIVTTQDFDLDGQSSSSVERQSALTTGNQFIIPTDSQKIIYRGLLYQRRERLGEGAGLKDYMAVYEAQNPSANLEQ